MAATPTARRPHMPGYATKPAEEGTGLLPWSWAVERLIAAHDYWIATISADGRPHVMPVWGAWLDDRLWFSSGRRSRKARNVERDPRCTATTDHAQEPVVVEGVVERVADPDRIRTFLEASNAKYGQAMDIGFLDPDVNGTYAVTPQVAFGMVEADFEGSPTRWAF